ncbi:coagulation factor IX-like [Arapaima gigas]
MLSRLHTAGDALPPRVPRRRTFGRSWRDCDVSEDTLPNDWNDLPTYYLVKHSSIPGCRAGRMAHTALLLITCVCLQEFWLGCGALVLLPRSAANSVLRRKRRYNTGVLEELLRGNLERECLEESCDLEEAREVFENDEKTVGCVCTPPVSDKHPCKSSPCQNGGQCADDVKPYTCTCVPGFTGQNCEIKVVRTCDMHNGGCMHFCVDTTDTVKCSCAVGYQLARDGITCEPKGAVPCGTLGKSIITSLSQPFGLNHERVSPSVDVTQRPVVIKGNKTAPTKVVAAVNQTVSAGNKMTAPANKVTSPGNKIAPSGNKMPAPANKVTSLGNKIAPSGNKMPAPANKVTSPGKKIAPLGNKTVTDGSKISTLDSKTSPPGNKTAAQSRPSSKLPLWATSEVREMITPRIMGGNEVIPGEIPWQVALVDRQTQIVFCGGSIISEWWVITAAHCLPGGKEISFFIRVGEHNVNEREGTEQDLEVAEIHPHPLYNTQVSEYNNDIALLRSRTAVRMTEFVRPICLGPMAFTDWLVQEDSPLGRVSGWGRLQYQGATSPVLRKVDLPFVSRSQCKASNSERVTRHMFCAGYGNKPRDACQGDSGGPHASRRGATWFLSGIVSWGEECGTEGKYGVYTRVSHYYDWIGQVTGPRKGTPAGAGTKPRLATP